MKAILIAVTMLMVAAGLSAPQAAQASGGSCSIASLAKDPRLASFSGYVADAATGEQLFSRSGTTPKATGSVLKLLTATAAITVLGPKYRMTTKVVAGSKKGTIVLVGGGDPTITRSNSGSFYPGAPKLSDLAKQVKKNYGSKITTIVLDSSYWNPKDNWDSTWKRSEQQIGYLSEVTALQVDGDRANPRSSVSHRTTNPVKQAGKYFAKALGVPSVKLVIGTAPAGAKKLASVKSQPISSLIRTMMLTSDGTLGEAIARVTSKVSGASGSSKSLQGVITTALQSYGLDTTGMRIRDGSGLSTKNGVSPKFVTQLLAKLRVGKHNLKYVYRGLSIAGRTGSLAARFTGSSSKARGHVVAKTGWLDTEYSLAGVVTAKDGTKLTFAFYAIGARVKPSAKVALDALTAGVYSCGSRLGNR